MLVFLFDNSAVTQTLEQLLNRNLFPQKSNCYCAHKIVTGRSSKVVQRITVVYIIQLLSLI